MKYYLVYGNRPNTYPNRYKIYADSKESAEAQVIAFGYDSAEAFDWDRMMRCELELFGNL